MLEIAMDLATVTPPRHAQAIRHDAWPIVPSQANAVVHFRPTLVSATDSVVYLFQDLVSFMSADASEEHFLSVGALVENASLVDVGGKPPL